MRRYYESCRRRRSLRDPHTYNTSKKWLRLENKIKAPQSDDKSRLLLLSAAFVLESQTSFKFNEIHSLLSFLFFLFFFGFPSPRSRSGRGVQILINEGLIFRREIKCFVTGILTNQESFQCLTLRNYAPACL